MSTTVRLLNQNGQPVDPSGSGGSAASSWSATLAVSPLSGGRKPELSLGDWITAPFGAPVILLSRDAQIPGPIALVAGGVDPVGGLDATEGGYIGGTTGNNGLNAGSTHKYSGSSKLTIGGYLFDQGNPGEGGDVNTGDYELVLSQRLGSGEQGTFLVRGQGAFLGLEPRASIPAVYASPRAGFWASDTTGRAIYRSVDTVDHILAYEIPVKARTTQALPAYTYANGTAGVGATITGNNPAVALPSLDGVAVGIGDTVYVANGSSSAHNGIYTVTRLSNGVDAFQLTRFAGADTTASIPGSYFRIRFGAQYRGAQYSYIYERALVVGTDPIFYHRDNIGAASPNECCYFYEDFAAGSSFAGTTNGSWAVWFNLIISGTGTAIAPQITNLNNNVIRGALGLLSGTTATARVGISSGWTLVDTQPDGGGSFAPATSVHLDFDTYLTQPVLSTNLQEYARVIGYPKQRIASAAGVQVKPADGIYFYYDRVTSLNWQCVTAVGGAFTTTVSGTAVTAGVYNRLQIQKDAGFDEVRFYIDGVLVATHTTHIPTAVQIAYQDISYKSVGTTTGEIFRIDYVKQDLQFPAGRAA